MLHQNYFPIDSLVFNKRTIGLDWAKQRLALRDLIFLFYTSLFKDEDLHLSWERIDHLVMSVCVCVCVWVSHENCGKICSWRPLWGLIPVYKFSVCPSPNICYKCYTVFPYMLQILHENYFPIDLLVFNTRTVGLDWAKRRLAQRDFIYLLYTSLFKDEDLYLSRERIDHLV